MLQPLVLAGCAGDLCLMVFPGQLALSLLQGESCTGSDGEVGVLLVSLQSLKLLQLVAFSCFVDLQHSHPASLFWSWNILHCCLSSDLSHLYRFGHQDRSTWRVRARSAFLPPSFGDSLKRSCGGIH